MRIILCLLGEDVKNNNLNNSSKDKDKKENINSNNQNSTPVEKPSTPPPRKERMDIMQTGEDGYLLSRYIFNEQSKLVREDNFKLNSTITYKYNANGNIVHRREYPYSIQPIETLGHSMDYKYYYSNANGRDYLMQYRDERFRYNSFSFPFLYRNHSFNWIFNKLSRIENIVEYTYDIDGYRDGKIFKDRKITFKYEKGILVSQEGEYTLTFNYYNDILKGFTYQKSNNEISHYTYARNCFGDISGIYDENNDLIVKYYYDYYGNCACEILIVGNKYDNIDNLLDTDIELLKSRVEIANVNPYRYRGYYYDEESGLYYNNEKFYDTELGRFITD